MIVVQCELQSAISGSRDRSLCRVEIFNAGPSRDGKRTACFDYGVRLYSAGVRPRLIKTAGVTGWPREQKPAWRLIQAAFKALDDV